MRFVNYFFIKNVLVYLLFIFLEVGFVVVLLLLLLDKIIIRFYWSEIKW